MVPAASTGGHWPRSLALIVTLTASTVVLWEAKRRTDATAAELRSQTVRDVTAAELRASQLQTEANLKASQAANGGLFRNMFYAVTTLEQIFRPLVPSQGVDPALNDETRRILTLALSYYEHIFKELAGNDALKEQVAQAYRQAGFCRIHLGKPKWQDNYRQAIRDNEEIAARFPERIWLRTHLIETLHEYSRLLTSPADKPEAEGAFRRALAVAEAMIGKPEVASHCFTMALAGPFNELAWDLVRRPTATPADSALAVRLARQAIEWEPELAGAGCWNTLGVAYYRLGDSSAATAAFQKSMELNKGGDPADWFFLAALDHHAGKQEEARRWFDRSVAWMEKNRGRDKARDAELGQFREEIGGILKVKQELKYILMILTDALTCVVTGLTFHPIGEDQQGLSLEGDRPPLGLRVCPGKFLGSPRLLPRAGWRTARRSGIFPATGCKDRSAGASHSRSRDRHLPREWVRGKPPVEQLGQEAAEVVAVAQGVEVAVSRHVGEVSAACGSPRPRLS